MKSVIVSPGLIEHGGPVARGRMRNAAKAVAVTAIALSLAACNAHRRDVAGWSTSDPTQNHPIVVDRKEVVLELAVPPGSYGLTHSQKQDVYAFARRFKSDDPGGVLSIQTPGGGGNELAAMRASDDIRHVISRSGVGQNEAVFESYSAAGRSAPIRVTYMRHTAQAPVCGTWPTNLARDPRNEPWPNLGCANQANLAAMISNPRDLVAPRGMTPRSSERRDVAWDKYVKGESSGAEKSDEEKSTVSTVQGGGQ